MPLLQRRDDIVRSFRGHWGNMALNCASGSCQTARASAMFCHRNTSREPARNQSQETAILSQEEQAAVTNVGVAVSPLSTTNLLHCAVERLSTRGCKAYNTDNRRNSAVACITCNSARVQLLLSVCCWLPTQRPPQLHAAAAGCTLLLQDALPLALAVV